MAELMRVKETGRCGTVIRREGRLIHLKFPTEKEPETFHEEELEHVDSDEPPEGLSRMLSF